MEANNKFQNGRQASGSAENKLHNHSEEENKKTILSDDERQNLAAQMGEGPNAVVGLKDMGALSGRDDAAAGSGDRMADQSTGDATNP